MCCRMEELRVFMDRDKVNILLTQEPYATHDISWPGWQVYFGAGGNEDIWTLTVVCCPSIKVILHNISNSACTVVEVMHENRVKCMTVNTYFMYNESIHRHLVQIKGILLCFSGRMVIISADVNARSCNGIMIVLMRVAKHWKNLSLYMLWWS